MRGGVAKDTLISTQHPRNFWGHAPQGNVFLITCSEIVSEANSEQKMSPDIFFVLLSNQDFGVVEHSWLTVLGIYIT